MQLFVVFLVSSLVSALPNVHESEEQLEHILRGLEKDPESRLKQLIDADSLEAFLYSDEDITGYFELGDDRTPQISDVIDRERSGDKRPKTALSGTLGTAASAEHARTGSAVEEGKAETWSDQDTTLEASDSQFINDHLADQRQSSEDGDALQSWDHETQTDTSSDLEITMLSDTVHSPRRNRRRVRRSEPFRPLNDRGNNAAYSASAEALAMITQKLSKIEGEMARLKDAVLLQGAVHIKTSQRMETMMITHGKLAMKNAMDMGKVLKRVRRCCHCSKTPGRKARASRPTGRRAAALKESDTHQSVSNGHTSRSYSDQNTDRRDRSFSRQDQRRRGAVSDRHGDNGRKTPPHRNVDGIDVNSDNKRDGMSSQQSSNRRDVDTFNRQSPQSDGARSQIQHDRGKHEYAGRSYTSTASTTKPHVSASLKTTPTRANPIVSPNQPSPTVSSTSTTVKLATTATQRTLPPKPATSSGAQTSTEMLSHNNEKASSNGHTIDENHPPKLSRDQAGVTTKETETTNAPDSTTPETTTRSMSTLSGSDDQLSHVSDVTAADTQNTSHHVTDYVNNRNPSLNTGTGNVSLNNIIDDTAKNMNASKDFKNNNISSNDMNSVPTMTQSGDYDHVNRYNNDHDTGSRFGNGPDKASTSSASDSLSTKHQSPQTQEHEDADVPQAIRQRPSHEEGPEQESPVPVQQSAIHVLNGGQHSHPNPRVRQNSTESSTSRQEPMVSSFGTLSDSQTSASIDPIESPSQMGFTTKDTLNATETPSSTTILDNTTEETATISSTLSAETPSTTTMVTSSTTETSSTTSPTTESMLSTTTTSTTVSTATSTESTSSTTTAAVLTTTTTTTTTEKEEEKLAVDLTTGAIEHDNLPGVSWVMEPSIPTKFLSKSRRWRRSATTDVDKLCFMQGVLRFSFTPPQSSNSRRHRHSHGRHHHHRHQAAAANNGGGDGDGHGERRKLLLEMEFFKPTRWVFNLGDSIANNGFSGDGSVQQNDCEAQGYGTIFSVYGSDKHPNGRQKLLQAFNKFLFENLTLIVSDQIIQWDNHRGNSGSLVNTSLFALSGQSDSQGSVNYDVYLGLNRVIAGNYRQGHGLCRVSARWLNE